MLTVLEVAEAFGVSRDTVYRLLSSGELHGERLTPHSPWRISRKEMLRYAAVQGITIVEK
jgi:excisionase family DNA binding protein